MNHEPNALVHSSWLIVHGSFIFAMNYEL